MDTWFTPFSPNHICLFYFSVMWFVSLWICSDVGVFPLLMFPCSERSATLSFRILYYGIFNMRRRFWYFLLIKKRYILTNMFPVSMACLFLIYICKYFPQIWLMVFCHSNRRIMEWFWRYFRMFFSLFYTSCT